MRRPLLLSAFLVLVSCSMSQADTLLATYSVIGGGGGNGFLASDVARVSFEFGNSIELNTAACVEHRVGCEGVPISEAFRGAGYTFRSTNSQWFNEVAGRLTNGIDDPLYFMVKFYDANGVARVASGQGGGPDPNCSGYRITSIQLQLTNFKLIDPNLFCGGPGILCARADMTWSVYGIPLATPALPASWGAVKSLDR